MAMTWQDHARSLGINPDTVAAGPGHAPETVAPVSKYGNVRARYDGRLYDSRAEAGRAAELDAMIAAGTIAWWYPHPQLYLGPGRVPYRPDFLVIEWGQFRFEDVKGVETDRFRVVIRLWKAHGPAKLLIIYRDRIDVIPGENSSCSK